MREGGLSSPVDRTRKDFSDDYPYFDPVVGCNQIPVAVGLYGLPTGHVEPIRTTKNETVVKLPRPEFGEDGEYRSLFERNQFLLTEVPDEP